jgi:hypothetical protein
VLNGLVTHRNRGVFELSNPLGWKEVELSVGFDEELFLKNGLLDHNLVIHFKVSKGLLYENLQH